MELAAWSGAADAPAVRDRVVSRPGLFRRLTQAQRVVQVSAPPGSGKTVLLRSWIAESGLAARAAWVSVPGECGSARLWISVADALRDTAVGSTLVRGLTAAPDLDGWTVVERLLEDLASLQDRVWLVIDDLHELGTAEALRQLELLIMRAPPALRFVLVTRHDLRLGLHRLRLAGDLTEIRTADLRFSRTDARALLDAAGVPLSDSALARLYDRTEGWAAGLRLAVLSLAGHPDPERFAAEFGGSERTVAEYLLAEVLERQSEEARRLLLRTSMLERVNGELADLLTGGSGGERVLQQLEEAGAFVRYLAGVLVAGRERAHPGCGRIRGGDGQQRGDLAAHGGLDHRHERLRQEVTLGVAVGKDQRAEQFRVAGRDNLRDHAAGVVANQVDPVQPEALAQVHDQLGHRGHRRILPRRRCTWSCRPPAR